MVFEINAAEAYQLSLPVIDVRSPSEYAQGHIPEALNIPLFTDIERAHIGTVYKNISQNQAIELGYKYAEPKQISYIQNAFNVAPDGRAIVHCLRGGMRSVAFSKLLCENGFTEIYRLSGGYKAYRHAVLEAFNNTFRLMVLGGFTGSGKTYILNEMRNMGEQVLDLEALAMHKGSAFGSIGKLPQTSTEQFENILHKNLSVFDNTRTIWVEDESNNIGSNIIPKPFFLQMRNAMLFFIKIPIEKRIELLVEDYAECPKENLAVAIKKISKRLGPQNEKQALKLLENEEFEDVAEIMLKHYDKAYLKGVLHRNAAKVYDITLQDTAHRQNASTLLRIAADF